MADFVHEAEQSIIGTSKLPSCDLNLLKAHGYQTCISMIFSEKINPFIFPDKISFPNWSPSKLIQRHYLKNVETGEKCFVSNSGGEEEKFKRPEKSHGMWIKFNMKLTFFCLFVE